MKKSINRHRPAKMGQNAAHQQGKPQYTKQAPKAPTAPLPLTDSQRAEAELTEGLKQLTEHQSQLLYFALLAILERTGDSDEAYEDAFYLFMKWVVKKDARSSSSLVQAIYTEQAAHAKAMAGIRQQTTREYELWVADATAKLQALLAMLSVPTLVPIKDQLTKPSTFFITAKDGLVYYNTLS